VRAMGSDDPDFETEAAGAIGLDLTPPPHAALFCLDEKTAIQALERLDPCFPCRSADWNGTVMSIAATACYLYMRHWT
jgi:hypothetical protein